MKRDGHMDITKRILLSKIVEKIEKNEKYSEKIGTKNKSKYNTTKKYTILGEVD